MPIYEYKCTACGHHLECIQKFSDEPLLVCPSCGKPALKKCVSMPSFQLKGTGWYETDFKSKKKVEEKPKEKPEKTNENKKVSTESDKTKTKKEEK
jgi:putative FmdB family regulatory protein